MAGAKRRGSWSAKHAALIAVAWRLTGSRYRKLAEQMVAADEANERRLAEIAAELSAMRTQLASLERVLTQIE